MSGLVFSQSVAEKLLESDCDFCVTGATGWLGRATLEMLSHALGSQFSMRVRAYGSFYRDILLSNGYKVSIQPLANAISPKKPMMLFHYAFLTKDKVGNNIEAYREKNIEIRDQVLKLISSSDLVGVILSSSGAVYNFLNSRHVVLNENIYGQLKYEDEKIFENLCGENNASLVISRIFNLSGPYINKIDSYALSSIILDALCKRKIRINAAHRVIRSYVFVGDVLEIAVRQLLAQNSYQPIVYDTRGDESLELGELALTVCEALDQRDLSIDREFIGEDEDYYVGSEMPWRKIIGEEQYQLLSMSDQIKETAAYLRILR